MKNRPTSDGSWKLIEHTADIRAEVSGSTLEELFVNAACGLTGLLYAGPTVDAEAEIDLVLDGGDVEEILVDWLREILYRKEAERLVFVSADVEELSAESLKVRAFFGPAREEDPPEVEIKAVTYHGLSVERNDSGFTAKILFDI
jgi:SHS2 domain-containing protein